jgi:hypothetical protein
MAHDVFVSYPHDQKPMADAVVNTLENRGIRCWVAPRDVPPGADWAAAIMTAITSSRRVVLVFSDTTNDSDHILREVRAASDTRIPIIPFRTSEADPSPSLQYYLGGTHWLDALTEPIETHLDELGTTVATLLPGETTPQRPPTVPAPATPPRPWWSRIPVGVLVAGGVAVVTAILLVVVLATTTSDDRDPTEIATNGASDPSEPSETGGGPGEPTSSGTATFESLFATADAGFALANGSAGGFGPSFICWLQGSDASTKLGPHLPVVCEPFWPDEEGHAEEIVAVDFDSDGGVLDIAFVGMVDRAQPNPNRACVERLHDPDGDFEHECYDLLPVDLTVSATSVAAGDLDSDGNIDLVVGVAGPGDAWDPVQVCLGLGEAYEAGEARLDCRASVQVPPVAPFFAVEDVAIVDVDADGTLDVALAVMGGPNLICLGDGTGYLACSVVDDEPAETRAVGSGDFDEDGRVDLVFANYRTPNRLCFNETDGFDCIDISIADAGRAVDVGDVNDDGHLDLLVGRADDLGDADANQTHLCLGDGTGLLECQPTPWESGGAEDVLLTDVNGDGNLDYLKLNVPWAPWDLAPDELPIPADRAEGEPTNATLCLGIGEGTFECSALDLLWVDERGVAIRGVFTGLARIW